MKLYSLQVNSISGETVRCVSSLWFSKYYYPTLFNFLAKEVYHATRDLNTVILYCIQVNSLLNETTRYILKSMVFKCHLSTLFSNLDKNVYHAHGHWLR